MMKEIAFQPGKFQPMVEIAQRDSGVPAPADTNFSGLTEVASATLEVAHAASRGYGSVISDPTPKSRLAEIIGYVLACRNIVEQLLHVGVHARVTTPLRSAALSPLEPIVRAYNYFGHFELEGKLYVGRALETDLIERLFWLRQHATVDVADGNRSSTTTTAAAYGNIDTDFYHLDPSGEIAFGKRKPLKEYLLDLVSYIHGLDTLTTDEKLPLLAFLLDVSTEASLNNFLRTAKTLSGFTPPDRNTDDEPSAEHKAAMKKLFGAEYSAENDTIPLSRFTGSITNAYNTLRRVSLEFGYSMKTIPIPKYEGGSAAQLASYDDDVLSSSVQVSLSDSTAAVAFTTCFGVSRRYKSAPVHDRTELLRELIAQSLLPVR